MSYSPQIRHHGFDIFSDPANVKYLNNLGPFSPDVYNFEDEVFGFLQDFYYYNLECKHADRIWWQSRILTYRKLLEIEQPNRARWLNIGEQYYGHAGWHFSFFGGKDSIINKIKSFPHQEYNTPEFLAKDNIEGAILTKQDLFGRDNIILTHLPLESNGNLPAHYEMLLKLGL